MRKSKDIQPSMWNFQKIVAVKNGTKNLDFLQDYAHVVPAQLSIALIWSPSVPFMLLCPAVRRS